MPSRGCGRASYDALQLSATRRFRAGFTGGLQYQYAQNKGTTQGSNEAATAQNTFDFETEYGTNPQDIPHTFNGSLVYLFPARASGAAAGASAASSTRAAACRSTSPSAGRTTSPSTASTVTNIPGGNSRGTQRPDLVPGVDPYLEGRRPLAQPGGVRHAAARHVRQPAAQLPARPGFWQVDLMFSKDFRFAGRQGLQFRVEMFNITNRLNYENPAATLPERRAGRAVHRRAGRHVRLHARPAEPHGRPRHRAADADLDSVHLLGGTAFRRKCRRPRRIAVGVVLF